MTSQKCKCRWTFSNKSLIFQTGAKSNNATHYWLSKIYLLHLLFSLVVINRKDGKFSGIPNEIILVMSVSDSKTWCWHLVSLKNFEYPFEKKNPRFIPLLELYLQNLGRAKDGSIQHHLTQIFLPKDWTRSNFLPFRLLFEDLKLVEKTYLPIFLISYN